MFRLLLNPLSIKINTPRSEAHLSAQHNSDEGKDDTGEVTQSLCFRLGGVSPNWSSASKTQQRNVQGPQILCGKPRGNLRFRKVQREAGLEQRLERAYDGGGEGGVGGAGWEPRPTLGTRGKQHQPPVHPLGPCPLQPPPGATRDTQGGLREGQTTGGGGRVLRLPGSGGWGRDLLYPLFSAQQQLRVAELHAALVGGILEHQLQAHCLLRRPLLRLGPGSRLPRRRRLQVQLRERRRRRRLGPRGLALQRHGRLGAADLALGERLLPRRGLRVRPGGNLPRGRLLRPGRLAVRLRLQSGGLARVVGLAFGPRELGLAPPHRWQANKRYSAWLRHPHCSGPLPSLKPALGSTPSCLPACPSFCSPSLFFPPPPSAVAADATVSADCPPFPATMFWWAPPPSPGSLRPPCWIPHINRSRPLSGRMRRQETLTSTVVAVAQFSSFPPNSLESRQVSGSDVMARPVSLETETPSAPFLKGRGLGFPEKLPIRTWKPEARLGLAQRRASEMCLGRIWLWRRSPPALAFRELGLSAG